VLAITASAFAGALLLACASTAPARPGAGLTISCCDGAFNIDSTSWHAAHQFRLRWSIAGREAVGITVTVTSGLTAAYCSISDLRAVGEAGPDPSSSVATAPVVSLSGTRARSPVSVVTIPRGTASGSYCLWTRAVGRTSAKKFTNAWSTQIMVG
jgi:hypothetical protein